MSEENNGVDVDEFCEGLEESAEVIEVGEEFTEKPAEEEKETPNVSVTDLLDDIVEEPEEKEHATGFVPVDKHLKLRKGKQSETARADAAEARVKELESQSTRTDAVNSETTEIDDDDFVTGKDFKGIAAEIRADAKADARAEFEAGHAKDLVKAKVKKANADQEVVASEYDDYYDVINAMRLNGISPEAKRQIANADNSAEEAYKIGCIIQNRKPAQKKTPTTTTPSNENNNEAEGGTTEEIFDSIFS